MTRSIWKGPFSEVKTTDLGWQKGPESQQQRSHDPKHSALQTLVWSRQSMILPQHVGSLFGIHTGKGWISVKVSEEMIGHKFGEFATTRKKPIHKTNKKKQVSSRKKE